MYFILFYENFLKNHDLILNIFELFFNKTYKSEFNSTIDYKKILNKDDLNVLEKNKKLSIIIQKIL